MSVLLDTTSNQNLSKTEKYLGEYSHFIEGESMQKALNFATRYPVLMKLATELTRSLNLQNLGT